MRDKEQIIQDGRNVTVGTTPDIIQIEVMTDIRDQLKRIADVLEYAREALENWQKSPA